MFFLLDLVLLANACAFMGNLKSGARLLPEVVAPIIERVNLKLVWYSSGAVRPSGYSANINIFVDLHHFFVPIVKKTKTRTVSCVISFYSDEKATYCFAL